MVVGKLHEQFMLMFGNLACHGFILGGILLAGASDIVLTTEDSYFGLPEIDRGALGGGAP